MTMVLWLSLLGKQELSTTQGVEHDIAQAQENIGIIETKSGKAEITRKRALRDVNLDKPEAIRV
jgi:hypothetical protein